MVHNRRLLSLEPDKIVAPSGEKQQHRTLAYQTNESALFTEKACVSKVLLNEPSRVLQNFRVLSSEEDNITDPSGEKQQHRTCNMRI